MKRKYLLLFLSALLLFSIQLPVHAADSANGLDKLELTQGSKIMVHNGKTVTATQPLTATKGVSYVAARSIMNEIYGTIAYDSKSKLYTLSNGINEIKLLAGNPSYTLNGVVKTNAGAPYLLKGTLMIPLRTVAQSFGLTLTNLPKEKKVVLTWASKPVANFSVSDTNPYAQQTEVKYTNQSYHPSGLKIIDERWENNNAIFDQAGTYTISHWVQDERGTWSDPYTVTITVRPPNQPPVAQFNTDKDTYKMGEFITYTDLSTDDENRIASTVWTNNERGFFVAGPQNITLTVTDANGAVNEYTKTITITEETHYTKEEFDLLYTAIGDKFGISGPSVLSLPKMPYSINDRQQTLIRANSPETILEEGIYYEDTVSGNVRFLLHNLNGRSNPVKIYVLLTNENAETATVRMGAKGIGGPNPIVSQVGRMVTGRFLESVLNPTYSYLQIPAGESRLIFQEYSDKRVRPGDVYSMFADVQMNSNLKFQVIVVDEHREVMSMLPYLKVLPSNDRHIRGTFENANRMMYVNQTIGDVKSRMILADNVEDTRLTGIDKTTGTSVLNMGNYGVLYTIRLSNVQPHTAIAINPRGGHYAGAFTINGKVVYATNDSILRNPNEVGMLYKSGDTVESVDITFTPANGSMLPINLLFLPMPELK
ncbi:copper amine oxidase N-terminal domain-containing protein [Cohnella herbarum]|uniref:Copper amine oxidase N-terminal domain-containing protein n=1 Tax=Cohnella herbarum TaxID=2728023 RepID=A0A7Z2VGH2_9BACL|nr:stalk domain-containing protein [Cohnella herbarum]QJD82602.1 copper amine oxidase N-terminal domain-containing protein [Cohnella herbarum]